MKRIRPIALCIFRNNGRILVGEFQDLVSKKIFYRPLGGGIEFLEPGEKAVQREIQEELSEDIENVKLLGYLENIFFHEGEHKHEIVMVFDGEFKDKSVYAKTQVDGMEANGEKIKALWKSLSEFGDNGLTLYPDGMLEFLRRHRSEE
ncbi:MAG: NUDIX hydrolase [Candidatus Zhuqueibacterota bacterium]